MSQSGLTLPTESESAARARLARGYIEQARDLLARAGDLQDSGGGMVAMAKRLIRQAMIVLDCRGTA